MSLVTMKKLLESGVHYGHQTRRWNPKMKPYIYAAKNRVYIIDLNKTVDALEVAYTALRKIAENNGKLLIVGTKKQAQTIVVEEALRSGSFFVNQRWLGGTLTNFRTIQKSIRRLIEIEEMENSGAINVYTKKEIALLLKEKNRLENFLGGIKEMKKLPDAVFVVDPIEDRNAVLEAQKLGIPVFGIVDTNCDPDVVDYAIPANDDAVRSIRVIIQLMADAMVEPKGGVLAVAYQDQDGEDISMEDVIINVEQQAAESERRRRQRQEERRRRDDRRRQQRGPRRDDRDDNRRPAREASENKEVKETKSTTETKGGE
ncbi:30S ribosomal protein S2 [Erysipelothrix larvae]|uniref:Small ribosomal subunit protein uS2 n=1 Tax=Erysipelothrix larvae TaxID=1514105 RepID=A0A0X8GZB8_9FIRM|nr:30S ribosomal protein S2 [Erysipelothrix larvae]AMC93192.1 30S ribosomal protein S2 [Erysipelothrix larvae]